MSLESNRTLEIKVGLFCLIGLLLLGGLALTFGRFGESVAPRYPLTVEFSNASGLLKGSSVLIAGAKVGRVVKPPRVLPEGKGVAIELAIEAAVKIPEDSSFHIGSSGLLGDRFVDVRPPKGPPEGYIAPGSVVRGKRESGMDDLTREGTELVEEVREVVKKLDHLFTTIDEEILNEESTENLRNTFANLDKASAGFATASEELSTMAQEAGEMVAALKTSSEGINPVLSEAEAVMRKAQKAVESIGEAAGEAGTTLDEVNQLVRKIQSDDGAIGALLGNKALREELQALIGNLRRHGVLFYRDSENDAEESRQPYRGPARGSRGPR